MNREIDSDPVAEVERLVGVARGDGVILAATGGTAVAICCLSARTEPLARTYADLDFVTTKKQRDKVERFFTEAGYVPHEQFNALNGDTRMFFLDPTHDREADVFVDCVRGCHELDLRNRLDGASQALPPADLLLSKLQVRETNRKDYQDIFAILLDHEFTSDDSGICEERLAEVCGNDWGWWRTVTEVSISSEAFASEILAEHTGLDRVKGGLAHVREVLEEAPKSRKWKMRARVGERVRWYEEPEEMDKGAA